jgi:putative transposase
MASIAAGSVSLTTAIPNAALTPLSKSQVTELPKSLDAAVEQFRSRPLVCGHYRFMQADASTVKVRVLSPIM